MRESLLQFVWQFQLFNKGDLRLSDGQKLTILEAGKCNVNGGPDFLEAKIIIDDLVFVGNIELHINSSDFKRHKHHLDEKYKSIILHVVYFNDDSSLQFPTLEMNGRIPYLLFSKYEALQKSTSNVLCKHSLSQIDEFLIYQCKESLVFERLEKRATQVLNLLNQNQSDWEAVTYQLLGKYFGAHLNKECFEILTQRLDYKILLKHRENPLQIEALLLGTAGFLNKDFIDDYPISLKKEFSYLRQKYNLKPMPESRWQFSKIRPISFPTVRLIFFAKMVTQFPIFQKIIQTKNHTYLFNTNQSHPYWNTHFIPDKLASYHPKEMGSEFINSIIINVFSPLLYAYGKYYNDEKQIENAVYLLTNTKPEVNSKVNNFPNEIFSKESAFDTQALIELLDTYCLPKKCLQCKIGHKLLRNAGNECNEDAVIYI